MKKFDLVARTKHGLTRPKDAIYRMRVKLLLKFLKVNLFSSSELNYIGHDDSETKVIYLDEIASASSVSFSDSKNLAGFAHDFSRRYKLTVQNVVINSEKSFVYTPDKLFISETSEWPSEQVLAFNKLPLTDIPTQIDVGTLGLANSGFYHWLTEDLPTFLRSEIVFPVLDFVNSNLRNKEVYSHLNVETIKVPEWAKVGTLRFASRGKDLGYLHPDNLKTLKLFAKSVIQSTSSDERKIYVSRSKSRRSIKDEISLEEYLISVGYEVIFAEEFSFLEQIKIFSGASSIIAPHGAGLTNALWATNARVLEISGVGKLNRCFEWQSKLCGQEYTRFDYKDSDFNNLIKFIGSWLP